MNGGLARTDVEAFRSALAREAGLRFDDDKLPFLTGVLCGRVRQTNSPSAAAYVASLGPASELAELARALSVTETYFLRNRDQFRALEAILRAREATPVRHLRLLSAGCSSGEEAYSLAIAVVETLARPHEWKLSILGIDLNPDALAKARAGTYATWSLRETPDALRDKYLRSEGGRHVIDAGIREMVRFEQHNLVQATNVWRTEAYDIVFCRNVLMYFTPQAAAGVVANIARSLSPGGYLFLGHAENLRGLSHGFHLRHTHDTFYYERKDSVRSADAESIASSAPSVAIVADDGSWFDAIGRASKRIEELSRDSGRHPNATPIAAPRRDLAPAMSLLQQDRFQEALGLLAGAPDPRPDAILLRATLLVSTGDVTGAERACEELLALDELDAGAHYIMAICREHAGDRSGAVEHSQAAAYLDSGFAMPHLQLGRIARRSGDVATARRELGVALGLLPREDAARIVLFGGGFGRDALIAVCRAELQACGGGR